MTGRTVTHASDSTQFAPLVDKIWLLTIELLDAVSGRLLAVPSAADGWTREDVLRHVNHCADVSVRLTESALAGRDDAWYPNGAAERAASIAAADRAMSSRLVDDGVVAANRLRACWNQLDRPDFSSAFDEPRLGRLSIDDLVALRATEILMHGLDLNVGLRAERWPVEVVTPLVPWRIAWLTRRPRPPTSEPTAQFWVEATDSGHVWRIVGDGDAIAVEAHDTVGRDAPVLRLTHRELLQVLLGRTPRHVTSTAVESFVRAFPGP